MSLPGFAPCIREEPLLWNERILPWCEQTMATPPRCRHWLLCLGFRVILPSTSTTFDDCSLEKSPSTPPSDEPILFSGSGTAISLIIAYHCIYCTLFV